MQDNQTIRVMIADDHQLVIDGLRNLVEKGENMECVGEANDGKRAVMLSEALDPDVILMDIDMPLMNGLDATKKVRKKGFKGGIIALTMYNEKSLVRKMLNAGANGFVLKNVHQEELTEAIRTVAAGKKYFCKSITLSLLDKGNATRKQTPRSRNYNDPGLTEREKEIVRYIAEGLSNKKIGEKLHISHRTVDTHRTNVMKKLEVNNLAGVIRFALENGFLEDE